MALAIQFRHLRPLAARARANAGIIRTTNNFMNRVEPLNLTFEYELAATGRLRPLDERGESRQASGMITPGWLQGASWAAWRAQLPPPLAKLTDAGIIRTSTALAAAGPLNGKERAVEAGLKLTREGYI